MEKYLYLIMFLCSLAFLVIYSQMYVKQHGAHYLEYGLLTMFTTLNYWMMSISNTSELHFRAQQGVYIGMIFIPIVMLKMCFELCKLKRSLVIQLLYLCAVLLVISVATTEITGLFYKSYMLDPVTREVTKEYGIAHTLCYIYLFSTIVIAIGILIANRKKPDISVHSYMTISCSFIILFVSALLEKVIPGGFNCDAVGIVGIEVLFLGLSRILPLYDAQSAITETVDEMEMMGIILVNKELRMLGYNEFVRRIVPGIENWGVDRKLSSDFIYEKEFRGMIEQLDENTNVYETTIEVDGHFYLNKMTKLKMNGRDCGYQLLIFDQTDSVKYQRLLEEHNQAIATELNLATEVQSHLLPRMFPAFPEREDIDLYASMDTAKEIGGDFYDFFLLDDSHLALIIADVSGKGIPAALFMVTARTLIKDASFRGLSVNEIFSNVNDTLCEGNDAGLFVTAWMAIIDLKTGECEFCNAGHNPPVLLRQGEEPVFVRTKPNLVLGCIEEMPYNVEHLKLEKGDRMYLYTDGVTEAENVTKEFFGEELLMESIGAISVNEGCRGMCEAIASKVKDFVGEAEQSDDITMLAFHFKGKSEE